MKVGFNEVIKMDNYNTMTKAELVKIIKDQEDKINLLMEKQLDLETSNKLAKDYYNKLTERANEELEHYKNSIEESYLDKFECEKVQRKNEILHKLLETTIDMFNKI